MHSLTVVEDLDVVKQGYACLLARSEDTLWDCLQLDRSEEALRSCVVVAGAGAAHAQPDVGLSCPAIKPGIGELAAPIRMHDQA